jgi:PAS domain S-box-containing protein
VAVFKIPLKHIFVLVIWTVLFVALNLVYISKFNLNRQHRENAAVFQVSIENQTAMSGLIEKLSRSVQIANTLSHSLALHVNVIERNQMLLKKGVTHPEMILESEENTSIDFNVLLPDYDSISTSKEADYLRKVIASSQGLFDQILVTDAFGVATVASYAPEYMYHFQNEWWQRSLMLQPGFVYQYVESSPDHAGYLCLSFPLYNYEDNDPVGIILCRTNLDRLLGSLLASWKDRKSNTYLISDDSYILGPAPHRTHPPVQELYKLTRRKSGPVIHQNPPFAAIATSLAEQNLSIVPDLNWSVITFYPLSPVYSFNNPYFSRFLTEWFVLLLMISIFSYVSGVYLIRPLLRFVSQIGDIAEAKNVQSITISGLPGLLRSLLDKFQASDSRYSRQLREIMASHKAFTDYARESALEPDRKKIAESFLHISIETGKADSGILFIHNPDYSVPMMLHSGITRDKATSFESLRVFDIGSKTIYFSWNHPHHQDVWDDDYQMILSVPVQTLDLRFGTLYLLFKQAIELDLERDQTLDLLAQQCAIYSSRAALYHSLERQISFTEGILTGIPWFICTINHELRITWHNNSHILLDEENQPLLSGSHFSVLLPRSYENNPDCPVRKTLRDSRPHELIMDVTDKNSQPRSIQMNTFSYKDETGRSRSVILFMRDISKEKSIESKMRHYMMAVDNIGEAVIITDMQGRITFTNKAFTRILNYTGSDVRGHRFDVLISGKEAGFLTKRLASASHGNTWKDEIELIDRHESFVTVSLTASIVKDSEGTPTGFVITCFDLTSRLEKEQNILKRLKELETIHKLIELLNTIPASDTSFKSVLEHVVTFSNCKSGVFLLFDTIDSEMKYDGSFQVDPSKPFIADSLDIPDYFVKFIDECRQGRFSSMLNTISASQNPVVWNDLTKQASIESKLFSKMGFKALLAVPLKNQMHCFGCIMVFSKYRNPFKEDDTRIFSAIGAQIAFSLYGKYLQSQLEKEARYILTGEIVSNIGGDVRQELQSLESSRHILDSAFEKKDWLLAETGWIGLNWHIWKLYQISSNIALYDSENEPIFFPENINDLLETWVTRIKAFSFSKKITLNFKPGKNINDVYINKPDIQRAFLNILTLAVDACWFETEPSVTIQTSDSGSTSNLYTIDIYHNGKPDRDITDFLQTSSDKTVEIPLLLTVAMRCIANHKGTLRTRETVQNTVFRLSLPRYPVTK